MSAAAIRNGARPRSPGSVTSVLYDPLKLLQPEKWREYYNPLRFLSVRRVVEWLQEEQLGIVANLTWLYRFVEERDATLSALIDRWTSAMEKLDWDIKVKAETDLPPGSTAAQAEAQRLELRTRYDNIDNIRDAINALVLARFRRYAHLEKHYDANGMVDHLEPVPQWNWARSGLFGSWFYNGGAQAVPGPAEGETPNTGLAAIDPDNFIIREVDRPVDVVALFCFLRKNMSQKDWDGFIEVFGIDPIFIELPPDMPVEMQAEYQAVADGIISDARGTLPSGAKIHTITANKGTNPFLEHIKFQDEQIVLKGTGGTLTMLTQQGSGHHAGNVHQDTFDSLAEAEAKRISEEFQRQFDRCILAEKFPGQPRLAWFELSAKEQTETSKVVADVAALAGAGLDVDPEQVTELTNYRVTKAAPLAGKVVPDPGANAVLTTNRARALAFLNRSQDADLQKLIETLGAHIDDASDGSWAPIMNRVRAVLDAPDAEFVATANRLVADVPTLLADTRTDAPTVKAWQDSLAAAFLNGLCTTPQKPVSATKGRPAAKNRASGRCNGNATTSRRAAQPSKT